MSKIGPDMFLLEKQDFESSHNGKTVGLFLLKNSRNTHAYFTSYGARWVSMIIKDKHQNFRDVVLGFDSLQGYLQSTEAYYGATVGRYANRIAHGKFFLHDKEYHLACNNGPHHLHGGIKGFHDVVWDVLNTTPVSVTFQYISEDMEEGYPGRLTATVTYTLTENDEIEASFHATTDKETVVNLTNHAYFNLNGEGTGNILNHIITINADQYTPIDSTSIPLGDLASVDTTAFDFRKGKKIGVDIDNKDPQLINGTGYDHNFALNRDNQTEMIIAAIAEADVSGIRMQVLTTEPGIQLYTGNFMNGDNILKSGIPDGRREGFCLETQHYPDSPNQVSFPSVVLKPGEEYQTKTIFRFGIKE